MEKAYLINSLCHPYSRELIRPGSYLGFLPCRMQLRQQIMRWFGSLSFVWIALDTVEMRGMNRLGLVHNYSDHSKACTACFRACIINKHKTFNVVTRRNAISPVLSFKIFIILRNSVWLLKSQQTNSLFKLVSGSSISKLSETNQLACILKLYSCEALH